MATGYRFTRGRGRTRRLRDMIGINAAKDDEITCGLYSGFHVKVRHRLGWRVPSFFYVHLSEALRWYFCRHQA